MDQTHNNVMTSDHTIQQTNNKVHTYKDIGRVRQRSNKSGELGVALERAMAKDFSAQGIKDMDFEKYMKPGEEL
eukprot:12671785-Heterocapsa_arctica.AAC.1